ncbi:MAG: c-type cytochrome [Gammaproteobacteria bacterium]|nr:c-type cytochrome [Gammaproteobacteria bacterium]MCW9003831.1 c-type cytochrome [Gammaproteobacteria bacterium]
MKTIICLFITGLLLSVNSSFVMAAEDVDRLLKSALRVFNPLPEKMPGSENDTAERIALGKKLFFETRLSINNTQSCASCHRLDDGFAGVDNLPTSPGARGEPGTRNSPTVLNAGWQRTQFWDGRAENLVEQAKGPILNPIEMAMPDEQAVVKKIQDIKEYQDAFVTAFPKSKPAVTYHNIAEAIAAFERTLITPSRFDDFLNGDTKALTQLELQGLKTFIKLDCKQCHDGVLLGGEAFEKLGKKNPYDNQSDQGMYALTKDNDDRMFFKVSALRNVALTAPYFHDGKLATLSEAVRSMAWLQLDMKLTDQQVDEVTGFLRSLTDKSREK